MTESALPEAPAGQRTTMPPEWAPHERTWMAFPTANDTVGPEGSEGLVAARAAWSRVAGAVARHEPVRMLVSPGDEEAAREALAGHDVELLPVPLDDAWARDSGLTFVHDARGGVAGVDWVFNGWGAQDWAAWENDQHVGAAMAEAAGVPRLASELVNEGGGFHVDGAGTVLLTRTVQLDDGRNPTLDAEDVEREVHARLGTRHAIWLPRGLARDYGEFGTRGHVDIVAAPTESGAILLHRQDDPAHPDYSVTRELKAFLEGQHDAEGRPLRIVDVPAPETIVEDGEYVDWSYINHYVANGVVVLCGFGGERDEQAARILGEAYPGREVEVVDARDIFRFGGGIHCITQQQPLPRTAGTGVSGSAEGRS